MEISQVSVTTTVMPSIICYLLTVENIRQSGDPFYPLTLRHNSTLKTTRQTYVHNNTDKSNMQNIWVVYPHAITPQVLVS